jgi:hypothetical protein
MRLLRRYVLQNLGLKLLALAISFSLWTAYVAQPIAEISYDAPLAFINVPSGVTIPADAPATVRLLVRGREAVLRRISPGDLTLTVDLGHANPGQTTLPLNPEMATAPFGTRVVSLTPEQVRVSWVAASAPAAR